MANLLNSHLDSLENLLICSGRQAKILNHPVLKGDAREFFIKLFLQDHIPENTSIGTGTIIDRDSQSADNQIDIILYKKDYPKITLGNTNIFLIESVISTIEIKSNLTRKEFEKAFRVASKTKSMKRSTIFRASYGEQFPAPSSYIVAYNSSVKIETILSWLEKTESEDKPIIDGIFIFGKGFICFKDRLDNNKLTDEVKKNEKNLKWYCRGCKVGSLSVFFYILLQGMNVIHRIEFLDVAKYVSIGNQ